jgi:RNA polymerase sigma factor (sigma-70 family)
MDDNEILQKIKDDDPRVFTRLYKQYHDIFINTIRNKYSWLSSEDFEDFYNDSFHALYRNIKIGRLEKLTCSLKTYIIQIGIFKAIDKIRKDKNRITKEIIDYLPSEEIMGLDFFEGEDNKVRKNRLVSETVGSLAEPCKSLLTLFWYEGKGDKEIVESTHYKTDKTVKTLRSRCMKNLKEVCLTEAKAEGIISRADFERLRGNSHG